MLEKLNNIRNLRLLLVECLLLLVRYLYVLIRRVELRSRLVKRTIELVQRNQVIFSLYDSSEIELFVEEKLYPILL